MNRSLANVIFGGIASTGGGGGSGESKGVEDCQVVQAAQVADLLRQASKVAIVPGYGMAVARAQHGVSRLTQKLRDEGTEVYFGIHEVAGRLPGHMNVLQPRLMCLTISCSAAKRLIPIWRKWMSCL